MAFLAFFGNFWLFPKNVRLETLQFTCEKCSVAKRGDLSRFVGFSTNLGGAIFQGGDFLKIVKCDFLVHKSLLNDMFRD